VVKQVVTDGSGGVD